MSLGSSVGAVVLALVKVEVLPEALAVATALIEAILTACKSLNLGVYKTAGSILLTAKTGACSTSTSEPAITWPRLVKLVMMP